jgi:hypothetical protein
MTQHEHVRSIRQGWKRKTKTDAASNLKLVPTGKTESKVLTE